MALYVSGQLLTEDYYAANKPAKGFLGTANIDSNTAWCHPVLHQRIVAAQAVRPQMRVVVVDPRRTATCEGADLHLPLRPGTDVALFAGLLRHLHEGGFANPGYAVHLDDVADAVATGGTVAETAAACGLPTAAVAMFFDWFARTKRVTTMFSQGVNQSSSGVDKVNAILNVHLLTGRIGKPLLSIHPDDAAGLADGGLAQVDSARGGGMLRVRQDRGQRRGTVFAPMHRTQRFCGAGRINTAVNPAADPISGRPEFKHTPVRIASAVLGWHGFVFSRRPLGAELAPWCAVIPGEGVWRHELAGAGSAADAHATLTRRHGGPDHLLPPRDWLMELFARDRIDPAERRALLAGRPAGGAMPEPPVCVCMGVGAGVIRAAIAAGCGTVAAVGLATTTGANCGSCRPEIAGLIGSLQDALVPA